MTTLPRTTALTTSFVGRMVMCASPETQRLVALGRDRNWDIAVLGQAPLPTEPLRMGDWLIAPAVQDSSYIPTRALERVQGIYAAGLRPQGFVIVHEAPLLLASPDVKKQASLYMPAVSPQMKSFLTAAARGVGVAALGLGVLAGGAAVALAVISAGFLLALPAALVIGAVLIDPILIAVTEDGYWIEIDRWASDGRPGNG
jgi:hypothetical protein